MAEGTKIEELPAGGGAAIPYGPVFEDAVSVATDANNNLYVTDNSAHGVYKILQGGVSVVTLSTAIQNPLSIALDWSGNVYVIDSPGNLWKLPASGGGAVLLANFGAFSLAGIALDANNDILLSSMHYPGTITQKSRPGCAGSNISPTGLGTPVGLVADPAGNVLVCNDNSIIMIPAVGGSPVTIALGLTGDFRVTLDKYGSIYVCISGPIQNIKKINRSGGYFINPGLPPGLNFDENTGTISGTPTVGSPATNYIVTAYNSSGRTSTNFTIKILSASHDADLSQVKPSAGVLSPAFSPSITSYMATVINGVRSLQLTPVTASPQATVTIMGAAVADSTASAPIPLAVGADTIHIVVTAPDGLTTKTYKLTVNRPGNNNDNLSSLKPGKGVLSPAFTAATTSYTANVLNGVTSMTVTPITIDPDATIKVNGAIAASGVASSAIPLAVGSNVIGTVVMSSSGAATKTYTITVTRAPSVNANLTSLAISAGAIFPGFSAATASYFTTVPSADSTIRVTPTTGVSTSTVKVNGTTVSSGTASGPIPLAIGSNTISIVVTAQDGVTTKTYTLTVFRPVAVNAYLSALTISAGALSPVFRSTTTSYTVNVVNEVTFMTITPAASDPGAAIKVNGFTVASGMASGTIELSVGVNTINIAVTASDGTTTKTYTVKVTRGLSDNANLSNLAVSAGRIYTLLGNSTGYFVTVAYADSTITVTPTTARQLSTVKVNGTTVASGTASAPIPVAIGVDTVSIVVTALDGVTTKTYTLTVTRPGPINADLSALTISEGTLSPVFAGATLQYNTNVTYADSVITITPVTKRPRRYCIYFGKSSSIRVGLRPDCTRSYLQLFGRHRYVLRRKILPGLPSSRLPIRTNQCQPVGTHRQRW